jgi:hypothetical protein
VNDFVEECRREWRRLGVPDPVANEMAADLSADLAEAESEGASAEEVLGSAAFDPRSFAADWAAERGVVPTVDRPKRSAGHARLRGARFPAAIAISAILAITGAVMLIASSSSTSERLALPGPAVRIRAVPLPGKEFLPRLRVVAPPGKVVVVPRLKVVPPDVSGVGGRIVAVRLTDSGGGERKAGAVLLLIGLVGILVTALLWLRSSRGRPLTA